MKAGFATFALVFAFDAAAVGAAESAGPPAPAPEMTKWSWMAGSWK